MKTVSSPTCGVGVTGVPGAQVESYSNMVEPVLDSLRYQTAYAFDVLTYLIIDRLAGSERNKLKPDGLNISDWLQARGCQGCIVCCVHHRMACPWTVNSKEYAARERRYGPADQHAHQPAV